MVVTREVAIWMRCGLKCCKEPFTYMHGDRKGTRLTLLCS